MFSFCGLPCSNKNMIEASILQCWLAQIKALQPSNLQMIFLRD